MSTKDVVQIDYTDPTITDTTPVRYLALTEPRLNVQNILGALDSHYGSSGENAHAVVTTTTPGFAPPAIFELLDSYENQLEELEKLLKHDVYPPYSIAIWNGEKSSIPTDWVVCDGTNGTPDLRYYFPIGVSDSKPLGSVGGSFNVTINNAYRLKAHTHTYQNAFNTYKATGSYAWFTKYGTLTTASGRPTDYDNVVYYKNDTTGSAGSGSSSSSTTTINYVPDHNTKWYIMRLPNSGVVESVYYTVTVQQPSDGKITTNVSGRVKKGTKLVISVTANAYYSVSNVYCNNSVIGNNSYRYVTEDITIRADISFNYSSGEFTDAALATTYQLIDANSSYKYYSFSGVSTSSGDYPSATLVASGSGNPSPYKGFGSLTVIAPSAGSYTVTFGLKNTFSYNGSSSGPYNSYAQAKILCNNNTVYESAYGRIDQAPFSGMNRNAGMYRGKATWTNFPSFTATLVKGSNTFEMQWKVGYVSNKHCTVYVAGLRATIKKN